MYGHANTDADLAASIANSPWHDLAAAVQDQHLQITSLPQFMKTLQSGTAEEKHATILGLHRRLYHKEAPELRLLLSNSGVPLSVLATVEDTLKSCEVCNAWRQGHAKPVLKVRCAPRFNNTVYIDLMFFSTSVVFIGVDEALRYCILEVVECKDQ